MCKDLSEKKDIAHHRQAGLLMKKSVVVEGVSGENI